MKLSLFRKNNGVDKDLKRRVLNNNEAILDVMGKNMKGARCCPFLGGQKCIGELCEHFLKFTNEDASGERFDYFQCAHTKAPMLMVELNQNIRSLIRELRNKS